MENKIVVPEEQLRMFMKDGAMNNQYGIQVYFKADKDKAQALLPPPLKVIDRGFGFAMGYIYIVNIREPSFAPWYMEGGIGIMAEYNGTVGLHFVGLMLSGPGAFAGMCSGRDGSGLPKKLCERIHVERQGDYGRCFIERGGTRLIDVELTVGEYNDPIMRHVTGVQENSSRENPVTTEGGCLLFRHHLGATGFDSIEMTYYDSPTKFYGWEPAAARVTLDSTADDPWGCVPIKEVLGAGWMVSDNWLRSQRTLHTYPEAESFDVMRYLFSGRYDRCTLSSEHQSYE